MSTYQIRPGRYSDLSPASKLYGISFTKEPLLDFMFPNRQNDSAAFHLWLNRKFESRWWTPGWSLTMLLRRDEKGAERPVGFTWWKRPDETLTFRERWFSLLAWVSPIANLIFAIRDRIFPIPTPHPDRLDIYPRTFATIEPKVLTNQTRREAWYLASLGVDTSAQGQGLGSMLLKDGLKEADEAGAATWLVAFKGLENFYDRFGFVEVARANVGELKDWEGGAIMFRGGSGTSV